MATTFLESGTDATGNFAFFQGSATSLGTLTSDTAQFQDGLRSIKSTLTGNGFASTWSPDGVLADAGTRLSFWARFSTVSPTSGCLFMGFERAANGSLVLGLVLNTNGTLAIGGNGTTAKSGSTVLSANTWYRISVSYVVTSTSNFTAKLYINGTLEATTTQADGTLATTTTSDLMVGINPDSGITNGGTGPAMSVWYDSIYVDNSSANTDPGNIHVTAKRPLSNGTTNGYTTQIGSGGSGYGTGHAPQVNEVPLSTTNGWSMVGAGSAVTEEYNIEGAAVGDVDISAATIVDYLGWLYSKSLASETAKIIVNNVQSNVALTSTIKMFTKVAGSTTYPAGTGTDIGQVTATNLTTVSLYECGIVLAYIPGSTPATSNSNFLMFMGL